MGTVKEELNWKNSLTGMNRFARRSQKHWKREVMNLEGSSEENTPRGEAEGQKNCEK